MSDKATEAAAPLKSLLLLFPGGVAVYSALAAALLFTSDRALPGVAYAVVAVLGVIAAWASVRRPFATAGRWVFFAGLGLGVLGVAGAALQGGIVPAFEAIMGITCALLGAGVALTTRERRRDGGRAARRRRAREKAD